MSTTRLQAKTNAHHYHIATAGAGEPLLLLHGFSGDSTTWQAVADSLAHRWRVIMLDIIGHGASDKPPQVESYRMPAVAADIINLLDQLDITRTHLLGYSMGGRLALYLALKYPDRIRSLLLESASPGLSHNRERDHRQRRDQTLADLIETRGTTWFIDYWERLPLWDTQASLPPERASAQRKQRADNEALGLANSLRGMGTGAQPSLWPDLPAMRIPTLLIVGAADDKFRRINEKMAQQMPRASLVVIPASGHNTHLENPSAFARTVLSFLQSL